MKRMILVISVLAVLFASGCSFLCRIPEEVKRSEELQYKQATRINSYLKEVNKNPHVLTDPQYERLNQAILEASEALVKNTKAQCEYFGCSFESEKRDKEE